MAVIALDERRAARTARDNATCSCGSQWFTLVRVDRDGAETSGAISMTREGEIFGYAGIPRCMECGNDYKP